MLKNDNLELRTTKKNEGENKDVFRQEMLMETWPCEGEEECQRWQMYVRKYKWISPVQNNNYEIMWK